MNAGKGPIFTLEERLAIVQEEIGALGDPDISSRIEVRPFENLLMHFAMSVHAQVIIRGLRTGTDFEYEFQMAGMNSRLNPKIETVFLMAADRFQFISSRFVKDIAQLGGEVSHFVSPRVAKHLVDRYGKAPTR
jgi:pantetheine-phosphate adenylyltransferase